MKRWIPVSTAAALVIALLTIRPGYSDDADKSAKRGQSQQTAVTTVAQGEPKAQTTTRKKPRRRLPNNYGKIGISKKQREEIYAFQATYNSQIEDLQKQIDALVVKRDAEVEGVLTAPQKKRLGELREATKQRALERAKKSAAKKSTKSAK